MLINRPAVRGTTARFSANPAGGFLRSFGFTLIELLVTIVVVAVLVKLALPAMQSFVQTSSLSSAGGELQSALARARAEAIGRSTFVTVSPQGLAGWSTGYQIFVNPLNSTSYVAGQSVGAGTSIVTSQIIGQGAPTAWNYVTWPAAVTGGSALGYVTFDNNGRPVPAASFPGRIKMSIATGNYKEIAIDTLGRVRVETH